jgi:hypothetical protein
VRRATIAAIVLSAVAVATAREFPVVPRPIILRLTGRIASSQATARAQRPDVVGLQIDGESRWIAIDRAVTTGDHAISGRAVLDMLGPFATTVLAVGDAQLKRRLVDAPDGTPVTVEGLVDRSARTYLLRTVQMDKMDESHAPSS